MMAEDVSIRIGPMETDGMWPDPCRLLLLKAAVLPAETANAAWAAWRGEANIERYDQVDHDSAQLLPMIYRSLDEDTLGVAWRQKMRGLYRFTWTRNSILRDETLAVVRSLKSAGIEAIFLGVDALMAGDIYSDLGVRPNGNSALLVNAEEFPAVEIHLRERGWQPVFVDRARYPSHHAQLWRSANGFQLALHGQLFPSPFRVVRFQDVAEHASRKLIQDVEILVPHPTDLLLYTCVQGRFSNRRETPPFLWVVDAHHLIRRDGNSIDWERLLENASSLDVLLPVRDALSYLRHHLQVEVCDTWLKKARKRVVSGREIRSFLRHCGEPGIHFSPRRFWLELRDDYLAASETINQTRSWPRFLAFLMWRLQHRRIRKTVRFARRLARDRRQAFRTRVDLAPALLAIANDPADTWRSPFRDRRSAA